MKARPKAFSDRYFVDYTPWIPGFAHNLRAVTIGGQYLLAQNIRMELFHAKESGSGVDARSNDRSARTMFQLFAGF